MGSLPIFKYGRQILISKRYYAGQAKASAVCLWTAFPDSIRWRVSASRLGDQCDFLISVEIRPRPLPPSFFPSLFTLLGCLSLMHSVS